VSGGHLDESPSGDTSPAMAYVSSFLRRCLVMLSPISVRVWTDQKVGMFIFSGHDGKSLGFSLCSGM
jgi:hypothetical protein